MRLRLALAAAAFALAGCAAAPGTGSPPASFSAKVAGFNDFTPTEALIVFRVTNTGRAAAVPLCTAYRGRQELVAAIAASSLAARRSIVLEAEIRASPAVVASLTPANVSVRCRPAVP